MTKQQIEAFGKITPGPWKFRQARPTATHSFLELWGDNHEIAATAIRKLPDQQKWLNEDEANMQAFAALPDLLAEREKMIEALNAISLLWPKPPDCAPVNPEWVGPHDGKSRAILLEAALDIARKALDEAEGGE